MKLTAELINELMKYNETLTVHSSNLDLTDDEYIKLGNVYHWILKYGNDGNKYTFYKTIQAYEKDTQF